MSVLVKGMQMPKSCCKCEYSYCEPISGLSRCNLTNLFIHDNNDKFPESCPLIELPEHHGRLFDQDDVKAVLYDMPDTKDKWDAIALLEWAIDKRWCIEAEGEDE